MERHCSRFSETDSVHFASTFYYSITTMSWARESAKVGLAGLTPKEAARGAMFLRCFQDMPDPLHEEIEIKGPDDIPMVSVSTFIHTYINTARCVYSTVHSI